MTFEKALICTDEIIDSIVKYDESIDYQLTTDDYDWIYKAREALEKQIPKKPLPDKRYFGVGKCPVCGVVFFNKDLITPFCGNCGQALDWREEQ